jgi:hypothetical protein
MDDGGAGLPMVAIRNGWLGETGVSPILVVEQANERNH